MSIKIMLRNVVWLMHNYKP